MKRAEAMLQTWWRVALTLALATGTASALQVGSGAGVPQPPLLRLTGFVGSAPDGVTTLGSVTLGFDQTVATLALAEVQTLNGSLTEGLSALRQYDLYSPNMLLVGDRALLQRISDAPPRARITLYGYVRGTDRLFVVEVQTS
jgi:hypothetical protein